MASLKQVPVMLNMTVLMGPGIHRSEDMFISCVCHVMKRADVGELSCCPWARALPSWRKVLWDGAGVCIGSKVFVN